MDNDPDTIRITAGPFSFTARFEAAAAPKTCAAFRALLPYRQRIIHVRWSGEACWIPLGDLDLGLGYENHTSYPAPGQILLYPGGLSETEILLGLWRSAVRQQDGPACRQPFPDDRRRAARIWPRWASRCCGKAHRTSCSVDAGPTVRERRPASNATRHRG